MPFTLMDAYANPQHAQALMLSREGTLNPMDVTGHAPRQQSPAQMLWRWEPWVRQSLAVHELLSPLLFPDMNATEWAPSGFRMTWRNGGTLLSLQRPAPAVFEAEIAQVLRCAELREDRSPEILTQIDGQWAHWASVVPMRPDLTPRTFEVLNIALQWAIMVELRFKHELACWRPADYSAQVQPMVTTPGHGTFPMGHAVQCFLMAGLLQALTHAEEGSSLAIQLHRTAFRMSFNRIVAGLHFPVDLAAGMVLGHVLTGCALAMAAPHPQRFAPRALVFSIPQYQTLGPIGGWPVAVEVSRRFEVALPCAVGATVCGGPSAWSALWAAAQQEWAHRAAPAKHPLQG